MEFHIKNTEVHQLKSNEGILYDIFIKIPDKPVQLKKGYPVMYLLDGNATFPIASTYAHVSMSAPKKNIRPVPYIIVGIAAHTADNSPFSHQRIYDFTPLAQPEKMPEKFAKMQLEKAQTGGILLFAQFIETVVKPFVEMRFPINKNNQTIVGHSLGGLFATYMLVHQRTAFQHYMIGSPSLWWNGGELLDESNQLATGKETAKIFVGTLEPSFMQERATQLATFLQPKLYHVKYTVLENKNHLDTMFETVFSAFKL